MKVENHNAVVFELWLKYLAVTLIIFLLDLSGKAGLIRRVLEVVVMPPMRVVAGVSDAGGQLRQRLSFMRTGAVRMVDMERQIAELSATAARVSDLERENTTLRTQLGSKPVEYQYGVGSLTRVSDAEVVVDFGNDVPPEGGVVVVSGAVVGVVVDVGGRLARVQTLRAISGDVGVRVVDSSGRQRADGVVQGRKESALFLTKVLQNQDISIGDHLVTSGSDGRFPKGLVVGSVSEVVSRDSSLYREALVKMAAEANVGEEVFWIKGWEQL